MNPRTFLFLLAAPALAAWAQAGADETAALNLRAEAEAERGRFDEAERIWRQALAEITKRSGPNSPEATGIVLSLAGLYLETGHSEKAAPLLRRFESTADVDATHDPVRASENLEILGLISLSRRSPAKALTFLQTALEIQESHGNSSDELVARILIGRAKVLGALGRREEAERDMRRAMAIVEVVHDPPPLLMIEMWSAAGLLHARAKEVAETNGCFDKATKIAEVSFGAGHPLVALVLHSYSSALRLLGEKKQAGALDRRAAAIFQSNAPARALDASVDVGALSVRRR